jgi:drug/metabolite transporter (DMT)-like permease
VSRVVWRGLPYAAVVFAACLWGTWSLPLRHVEAMAPMPSAQQAAIVLAVMTIVAGLASLRDRVAARSGWRARLWIVWLGVADAFNVLLFFAAYKITIGVAVLAHYLAPIFVAVASPFALGERLTVRTVLAAAAAFSGLAVMVAPFGGGPHGDAVWRSAALGAASAFFYAANVVATKFVVDSFSTSETVFWHGIVATLLLAAFVPPAAWGTLDRGAVGFLAMASIGPGALAGMAFVWGLRRIPATHASILTLLEPLVALVLGAIVFGEALGARAAVGAALILAGAAAVMTQARAPAP